MKKNFITLSCGAYLLAIALQSSAASPNTVASADTDASEPQLTIESVKMDADLKENSVVFTEKVVAADRDYTLNSDKLTIFLCDETRNPKKIVAEGRVKITQQNLVSESEKATILPSDDKVILEGNARVFHGGNVFSGKTIEYTRSSGRVLMREGVRVSISDMKSPSLLDNPRSGDSKPSSSQNRL